MPGRAVSRAGSAWERDDKKRRARAEEWPRQGVRGGGQACVARSAPPRLSQHQQLLTVCRSFGLASPIWRLSQFERNKIGLQVHPAEVVRESQGPLRSDWQNSVRDTLLQKNYQRISSTLRTSIR